MLGIDASAEILGSVIGAFGSIIIFKPTGKMDAATRFITSFGMGMVGGPFLEAYLSKHLDLELMTTKELELFSSTCTALFGWFAAGYLRKKMESDDK